MTTIQRIYESIANDPYRAAPTDWYNEGNLLLSLFEAADRGIDCLPFLVDPKSQKASEGNLESAFPRLGKKGKSLGEGHTRADGVVGHFTFRNKRSIDLDRQFTQFRVLEAKLAALLSSDVTNCDYWDQLTRIIGCMARLLQKAGRRPETCNVGLHIVAPAFQIKKSYFAEAIDKDRVRAKLVRRVGEYKDYPNKNYAAKHPALDEFLQQWALPMVERMELTCYPWEDAIDKIEAVRGEGELAEFYKQCLSHCGLP
jgi:hypothetical protein